MFETTHYLTSPDLAKNMNDIIRTSIQSCVGCNKCMRVCPVSTANVAFMDRHQRIKVRTDNTKCLACGSCIDVCPRRARYFVDDTESFFADLAAGKKLSVLISPSVRTNFSEYKTVINYLRQLGVNRVYDVSLGVDIYVWAHMRYLERNHPFTMITTYCPVIVSYCELHRPELLPRLSPVKNPTCILAIYLKNQLGNDDDLAVVSPCMCKQNEFDPTKENLRYNLTFARLHEHIVRTHPEGLEPVESDFDLPDIALGSAAAVHEGFMRNFEFFMGDRVRIDSASGQNVFGLLDSYASSDPADLPQILDLVSCDSGCSLGPGHSSDLSRFRVNNIVYRNSKLSFTEAARARYEKLHAQFDADLEIASFFRQFIPTPLIQDDYVAEDRIEQAFLTMGKRTRAQRTIDCFACGSATCREMASKIAMGVNIPRNCTILAKDRLSDSNKRFNDYLQLIRIMGEYMLASGQYDKQDSIENSLMALCSAINASKASIWRTTYDRMELPRCHILLSFPSTRHFGLVSMNTENMPGWLEALGNGEPVIRSSVFMTPKEKKFFIEPGFDNLCCVPVMAEGDFWGFVMIVRGPQHPFTPEEMSVIESASFLIMSNFISSLPHDPVGKYYFQDPGLSGD
ncbi:MAG: 4Fe-4S binding protein [Deltaproteobacteria bacterium]|nr:4Fe-4S binding protein [Deltaproteobacteria bacterium]